LRGRDAKLDQDVEQVLADRFDKVASYDGFSVFVRRP
jgi:hypothetical protein